MTPITPVPIKSSAQAPAAKTKEKFLAQQQAIQAIQKIIDLWQNLTPALLLQQGLATPPQTINLKQFVGPSNEHLSH